ncbi:iron complex transport system permease protein [Caldalkalibacillus uzonensis]|uniref:Iron complex transport system permease protein n=1 Tax=Caldalkalibacillus uzonensis TaxID=353224 RepID=A0ABU0CQU8_9BACI|nr:iron chelate uptake ABC transporter family permease subunit [Caldalkalibacillus uzonensis]MDQ0338448.1 iron complex transport system permease protein [Caldalkalibacillus uzonensis]
MSHTAKISILGFLAAALVGIFMFIQVGSNWEYVLPRRGYKVLAMVLTGAAIAFSTIIFQTVTNNRILTPSIIGLDALYVLIQTVVIFAFGSSSIVVLNKQLNFIICLAVMVGFALLLYQFLFRGEGRNLYFLLLVGVVCGTLFGSLSTFMQVLIDPNEFFFVQDRMFASFNNINTDLLLLSAAGVIGVGLYSRKWLKYLDVLALGREEAINLGVNYASVVQRLLVIIAVLVSISTALVGPVTFLGLLVANVTYEFMQTYRHHILLASAILISIIALVGGQLLVERVFAFSTPLSVIINFIGGSYFLYLLLRESRAWSR